MGFAVVAPVVAADPVRPDRTAGGVMVVGVRTVVGGSSGVALVDEPPQPVASAASPRVTTTRPVPVCRLICMRSRSTGNVKA